MTHWYDFNDEELGILSKLEEVPIVVSCDLANLADKIEATLSGEAPLSLEREELRAIISCLRFGAIAKLAVLGRKPSGTA